MSSSESGVGLGTGDGEGLSARSIAGVPRGNRPWTGEAGEGVEYGHCLRCDVESVE